MTRLYQLLPHSIFLGICAVLLGSLVNYGFSHSTFIFSSTTFGYLYLRKNNLDAQDKTFFWLVLWGLLIAIGITFFLLPNQAKAIAVFSSTLTLLYAQENSFSLRKFTLLKPIIISFCWALNTVAISYDNPLFFIPNDHSVLTYLVHIFVLTYVLSLLYDLRDFRLGLDDTRVFYSVFGFKNTKIILLLILNICTVLTIFLSENTSAVFAFFVSSSYTVVLIEKANPMRLIRYTWLVDSVFIVYWAADLLSRLVLKNFI